jgi:hypothetical protein
MPDAVIGVVATQDRVASMVSLYVDRRCANLAPGYLGAGGSMAPTYDTAARMTPKGNGAR